MWRAYWRPIMHFTSDLRKSGRLSALDIHRIWLIISSLLGCVSYMHCRSVKLQYTLFHSVTRCTHHYFPTYLWPIRYRTTVYHASWVSLRNSSTLIRTNLDCQQHTARSGNCRSVFVMNFRSDIIPTFHMLNQSHQGQKARFYDKDGRRSSGLPLCIRVASYGNLSAPHT